MTETIHAHAASPMLRALAAIAYDAGKIVSTYIPGDVLFEERVQFRRDVFFVLVLHERDGRAGERHTVSLAKHPFEFSFCSTRDSGTRILLHDFRRRRCV